MEMGRWHGVKKVCKERDSGEVEDVGHWLLQCSTWDHFRQPLLAAMDAVREDSQRTRQLKYHHLHVGPIVYWLLLNPCGRLGFITFKLSSNLLTLIASIFLIYSLVLCVCVYSAAWEHMVS